LKREIDKHADAAKLAQGEMTKYDQQIEQMQAAMQTTGQITIGVASEPIKYDVDKRPQIALLGGIVGGGLPIGLLILMGLLDSRLGVSGPDGILEAMTTGNLLNYVRSTDVADLSILPVGLAQLHHAGIFSPAAVRRLVNEAKKHFEIVLIDTGPILGSIEATPVAAAVEGVILTVARLQQRPMVEKALEHLRSIGARVAGVVFNRAQAKDF